MLEQLGAGAPDAGLLGPGDGASYLASRGIDLGAPCESRELGGGISNIVLLVEGPQGCAVVKQALPRLRVSEEWLASQGRVLIEAAALQITERLVPGLVPRVLDVDPQRGAITIECADARWGNLKDAMLSGPVEPSIAAGLGRLLGRLHSLSAQDDDVAERLGDHQPFEQLRVDPYYRTVAARRPGLGPAIEALLAHLASRRQCLVHGDFSPKNVLTGPDGMWVLDFEVAHHGDPAFDVAFFLNHVRLKSLHRPGHGNGHRAFAAAFWGSYLQEFGLAALPEDYVVRHIGALMIARVDGKSPVEYLDRDGQEAAIALGQSLLLGPARGVMDIW